ncbi:MAG: hypothetical protein WAL80_25160 [Xanthobacteraceae bacterium]
MSNARLILVVLLSALPAVWLFDGPIVHGLVAGVAAVGLIVVSRTMRPGETEFFLSFARRAALFAAIPALWILIQVLPIRPLANPMWASAEAAIGYPLAGSISIDTGESVMALGQYLTIAAIGFWSAAVAVDRQRAEWILFALMGGTALIAMLAIANIAFGLRSFGDPLFAQMQAIDCVALGIVIALAAGIRTLERYETRHASPYRSVAALLRTFAACATALVLCATALILLGHGAMLIGAAYGAVTLVAVVCIRRLGLGPWGVLAFAVPIIGIAVFLVVTNPALRTGSPALAFTTGAPASLATMTQRILDDAPLVGTGAGTYGAIAPIYRDVDDQSPLSTAPTAASEIAIELGRPTLWLIVAAMVISTYMLLRASLRRGRDSFYPMAGAGCLIALLFLIFMNPGSLGMAPAMIIAATLGLAFAQARSRTVQQ